MLLPLGQSIYAQDVADSELDDDIILLSPFEVDSSADVGYLATTTMAGTRLRTNLKDTGSALQVVTQEYMQDINATSSEDLLVYTTGTEVGGVGGNFAGLGDGSTLDATDALVAPQNNTRVRGLTAADNARNFFLTSIPWDSYNTSRIDIQRGPNAILFGLGSPAGLINGNLDGADIYNEAGKIELSYGSYDSQRASINYNHVILQDELAVRFAALDEKTYYRQEPCFEDDERVYAAVEWQPQFMKDLLKGVDGKTTIKANYEKGSIDANRPRPTPPVDAITPWFTELNKATWAPNEVDIDQSSDPNYSPWYGAPGGRIYGNCIAVFGDPNSSDHSYTIGQFPDMGSDGGFGNIKMFSVVGYSKYASKAGLVGTTVGAYKDKSITDTSIFDFYNKSLEGDNKREWQDFDAYNFSLSQTFFGDSLGFEITYDKQDYTEGSWNMLGGAWSHGITVDIMENLIQPELDADGNVVVDAQGKLVLKENPNVGRAMIASDSITNREYKTDREVGRFTAFYDLDFKKFMDPDSALARILNRSVFTGVYTEQKTEKRNVQWVGYTPADGQFNGINNNPYNYGFASSSRMIATMSYLSGDLRNKSLGEDLGIDYIHVQQNPTSGSIWEFDSTLTAASGNGNTQNYVGWKKHDLDVWNANLGDRDMLYRTASLDEEKINSKIFVWQGFLFDGNVVPIIGYREDSVDGRSLNLDNSSIYTRSNQSLNIYDPTFTYGDWEDKGTEDSLSWSVTVHAPEFIKKHLPWGMNVSLFYNKSENFKPGANDIDVLGNKVPGSTGETKDYGFVVSILEDRLVFKVNKYETTVENDRLNGEVGGAYLLGYAEGWAREFALKLRNADRYHAEGKTDQYYGYYDYNPATGQVEKFDQDWTGTGAALRYNPANIGFDTSGMTDETAIRAKLAEALAYQENAVNAVLDPANRLPDSFIKTWQLTNYDSIDGGEAQMSQPNNLAITGDTQSKGYEFELTARPTDNWNISLNVAKTEATRFNLAESFSVFVEERNKLYEGAYGDIIFWGDNITWNQLRAKWNNEFWGNYKLYNALTGSNNPEVRKWRVNLVTNYKFTEGTLKGLNVGLGYRWEDKYAIGYPVTADGLDYDVTNPYYGPTESHYDMWIGYERDLTEKLHWRIQLNVKNLFADDDLIPITCQPDGSPAAYRIPDETTWTVTNTFSF
jgi:hypothetical protein